MACGHPGHPLLIPNSHHAKDIVGRRIGSLLRIAIQHLSIL